MTSTATATFTADVAVASATAARAAVSVATAEAAPATLRGRLRLQPRMRGKIVRVWHVVADAVAATAADSATTAGEMLADAFTAAVDN